MSDLIAEIADLTNDLREICESNQAFDVRVNSNYSQVFINNPEVFFTYFRNFDEAPYKSFNTFNYEISSEIEGVKFYTLITQSEYVKYVLKKNEKDV